MAQAQAAGLPLELWAFDESRFGLHTIARRRLTLKGVKPIGQRQIKYAAFWSYGLVAPRSDKGYFATRRTVKTPDLQAFINDFAAQEPDHFHLILLDNAPSHHAADLTLPSHVALLFLPPYAPELNPVERVWRDLKDRLAWRTFPDLLTLQDALATLVEAYSPQAFHSLIAFPFLLPPSPSSFLSFLCSSLFSN